MIEIDDDVLQLLNHMRAEDESVSDVIRRLLEPQHVLAIAINLYRNHTASLGKSAGFARLTVEEFVQELQQRDVPIDMGTESLEELEAERKLLMG